MNMYVHPEYPAISNGILQNVNECQTFGSGKATQICQEMLANLKETFKYVKQVHVPDSMNLPRRWREIWGNCNLTDERSLLQKAVETS